MYDNYLYIQQLHLAKRLFSVRELVACGNKCIWCIDMVTYSGGWDLREPAVPSTKMWRPAWDNCGAAWTGPTPWGEYPSTHDPAPLMPSTG